MAKFEKELKGRTKTYKWMCSLQASLLILCALIQLVVFIACILR